MLLLKKSLILVLLAAGLCFGGACLSEMDDRVDGNWPQQTARVAPLPPPPTVDSLTVDGFEGQTALANASSPSPASKRSSYYAGVSTHVAGDTLKAQLGFKSGLVVLAVFPGTPAEKAGLKVHDILLSANDREFVAATDLSEEIEKARESDMKFVVLREGKRSEATLRPIPRPPDSELAHCPLEQQGLETIVPVVDGSGKVPDQGQLLVLRPGVIVTGKPPEEGGLASEYDFTLTRSASGELSLTIVVDGQKFVCKPDELSAVPEKARPFVDRLFASVAKGGGTPIAVRNASEAEIRKASASTDVPPLPPREGTAPFQQPDWLEKLDEILRRLERAEKLETQIQDVNEKLRLLASKLESRDAK